jgi:hypothetical protein
VSHEISKDHVLSIDSPAVTKVTAELASRDIFLKVGKFLQALRYATNGI